MSADGSFPRRYAKTRRFTLGRPRSFAVAADGSRVAFLRSSAGDDPVNALWVFDVAGGTERLVADPATVRSGDEPEDLPPAERARRERAREGAGGIVAYAADPDLRVAAFALGGRLFVADLVAGGVRELPATGPAFDPRPDPTGRWVAYVSGSSLRAIGIDGEATPDRLVIGGDDANVTWGLAEFIAAEEMGRDRGFWWAPDGEALAVARVDVSPVQRWHVADPADPAAEPQVHAYPAAGTANADVSLSIVRMDGARIGVRWDRDAFPYLVEVTWQRGRPLLLLVQSRDQRSTALLAADVEEGHTSVIREDRDAAWLEIVQGVPAWTTDGRVVTAADRYDTRRLMLDGEAVTPAGLQVRRVVHAGRAVVFVASEEPTEEHVWRLDEDGSLGRLTEGPGVNGAAASDDVVVLASASLESSSTFTILWIRSAESAAEPAGEIRSFAERPVIEPRPSFLRAGERQLRTALLLPADRGVANGPGSPLPVLLDPYGGPHAQRVVMARDAFLLSQWFADQGFAVVVADGRGTPGRGAAWERAVHLDLATAALEDQVDALHAVAEANPGLLDLGRVAIRGWSFGGYLAALAVLRRPGVFHAAVAGAPVTDWRLYDTHYTERYLGHPHDEPEAYERSSLLADAARLERPLMLIHGLADDNVVAAHTLRLSSALLAAGRPHTVLPLSGVTHMTPQEVVAENLLLLQVAFLREALALDAQAGPQR